MEPDRPKLPSRRERPAKPPLTRQGIIDVALGILQSEGMNKVTMRRVAAALDTGASSLYVYVRDTEDLHAQILDALLGTLADVPAGRPWREGLHDLVRRYMALLLAYPEIARMAMITRPNGPNYLSLVERVLALLSAGGVPDREAAWAVDLLLLYATAHAAELGAWEASGHKEAEFSALASAVANADARTYPHIARLSGALMSGGPERQDWHLEMLINGALHTPMPPPKEERS